MTTKREAALVQALKVAECALLECRTCADPNCKQVQDEYISVATEAIDAALALPLDELPTRAEPVAWIGKGINIGMFCADPAAGKLLCQDNWTPLYAAPADRDAVLAEIEACHSAMSVAEAALSDVAYTEEGLEGDTAQRVIHLLVEARVKGTFDRAQYGDLDGLDYRYRAEKAEAELAALKSGSKE